MKHFRPNRIAGLTASTKAQSDISTINTYLSYDIISNIVLDTLIAGTDYEGTFDNVFSNMGVITKGYVRFNATGLAKLPSIVHPDTTPYYAVGGITGNPMGLTTLQESNSAFYYNGNFIHANTSSSPFSITSIPPHYIVVNNGNTYFIVRKDLVSATTTITGTAVFFKSGKIVPVSAQLMTSLMSI